MGDISFGKLVRKWTLNSSNLSWTQKRFLNLNEVFKEIYFCNEKLHFSLFFLPCICAEIIVELRVVQFESMRYIEWMVEIALCFANFFLNIQVRRRVYIYCRSPSICTFDNFNSLKAKAVKKEVVYSVS